MNGRCSRAIIRRFCFLQALSICRASPSTISAPTGLYGRSPASSGTTSPFRCCCCPSRAIIRWRCASSVSRLARRSSWRFPRRRAGSNSAIFFGLAARSPLSFPGRSSARVGGRSFSMPPSSPSSGWSCAASSWRPIPGWPMRRIFLRPACSSSSLSPFATGRPRASRCCVSNSTRRSPIFPSRYTASTCRS